MFHSLRILLLVALFANNAITQPLQLPAHGLFLADPTIYAGRNDFFLYGTVGGNADSGFIAYRSKDFLEWKRDSTTANGYALMKGYAFGKRNFWAPQVVPWKDGYRMIYVADEQIAIAEAPAPGGPFTQSIKQPLAADVKQIDPFLFIDDDGKLYLYHVRLEKGNRIFVAEMENDLGAMKAGTLRECISASEPWENTAAASWPVTEGPTVIKHNGLYYLIYTANDFRNPDYAVGYAIAGSPLGPWKKSGAAPFIHRSNIGMNGTGHGDIFIQGDSIRYVFHTHFSNEKVGPRRTALVSLRFNDAVSPAALELVPNSFRFLRESVN